MPPLTKKRLPSFIPLDISVVLAVSLLAGCSPTDGVGVQGGARASDTPIDALHDRNVPTDPASAVGPQPSSPTFANEDLLKTVDSYLQWSNANLDRDHAPAEIDEWIGRLGGAADMAPTTREGTVARMHLVALLNVNRRYAESIPQVELLVAFAQTEPDRLYWLAELAEIRFLARGLDPSPATRAVTHEAVDLALSDLAAFLSASADRCASHQKLLERHGRLAMYGCELARSARDSEGALGYLKRGHALGEIAERFGFGDTRRPAGLFEEELLVELTTDTSSAPPEELIERLERIHRRPRGEGDRLDYLGDRVLRSVLASDALDPLPTMSRVAALGVVPTLLTLERARSRCAYLLGEDRHSDLVHLVDWCVLNADVEVPRTDRALAQLAVLLGAAALATDDEALTRRAVDLLLATAGADFGDEAGALHAFQRTLDEAEGS